MVLSELLVSLLAYLPEDGFCWGCSQTIRSMRLGCMHCCGTNVDAEVVYWPMADTR